MIESSDPFTWNEVYKDLAKLVGEENTLLIYQKYRGFQINFPMRLISSEYIGEIAAEEYEYGNLKELAQKYGYSERHLRRLIKEERQKEIDQ